MLSQTSKTLLISLLLLSLAKACTITNTPAVDIGNYAVICAKLTITTGAVNSSTTEYYFKNIIDEFSKLTMTGLATLLTTGNVTYAHVTLFFQNSAINSTFVLIDSTNSIQRHFFSVVVNLNMGGVVSIVGDNFCDANCVCYQSQCFESIAGGYGVTDGVIFVSWGGDDANGKSLLSSARRLSRFNMYSVNGVYNSVRTNLGY